MQDKDSFFTLGYRGHWIHGCHNRSNKREQVSVNGHAFNSVITAKRWVDRKIKALAKGKLPVAP